MRSGDTVIYRSNAEIYDMIVLKYGDKVLKAWSLKDILINYLAPMFAYKDLPESIPEEFIERFHILNGDIAAWKLDDQDAVKYKDELIVSCCGYADQPDVYGRGSRVIASTLSGYVKDDLVDGESCVVIHNNSMYTSDMAIINQFTDMLTEMLTSLKTNIIYSRLKPIFKVSDDKEAAAVKEAFTKIKDDSEPIQITSNNVLAEALAEAGAGSETIKVLDITDVKNADKLQYIVKAIDDVFRWFFSMIGQAIQGNGKLAQQTVDEVQGTTSMSFILPNDRLKMRRRGWDKVNEIFGTSVTVDFSDAWKTESIKYKKEADIDENGEFEELETQPETQPEGEPESEPESEPEEGEKEDEESNSD